MHYILVKGGKVFCLKMQSANAMGYVCKVSPALMCFILASFAVYHPQDPTCDAALKSTSTSHCFVCTGKAIFINLINISDDFHLSNEFPVK